MFRKLKWKLVRFNMALLSLVFIAIFAVTAVLMIAANEQQTQMTLNAALHMRDDGGHQPPPVMGAIRVILDEQQEVATFSAPPGVSAELVQQATEMAQEQEQERGNFSLDTYHFSYAFDREHAHLVLLDQTGSIATQRNILLILFGVTILSLLLLFGLSTLFATRTVRPVKEAFDRQKNFVADASHELKTPLAILNANLSVLAENGTESVASQDQWISAMQVQITRMNGLINDMLTLAKLDHDQDAIPTRAVDFSRLTTGCLLSFEAVAYEKGVEIRSRISEHLMVNGSPERFSRLVDILLDNAVKHTPSGGIVEVVLSREKNHAVLSVRNSGEEISPDALPHVFDRFYRADSARSRETGGYGLGLAIAKSIVENAHGKISAASADNHTTFSVELPIYAEAHPGSGADA